MIKILHVERRDWDLNPGRAIAQQDFESCALPD